MNAHGLMIPRSVSHVDSGFLKNNEILRDFSIQERSYIHVLFCAECITIVRQAAAERYRAESEVL